MTELNRRLLLDTAPGGEYIWRMDESDVETPPPHSVIVKVMYCGICHSDAHASKKGCVPKMGVPRVLGHEISGVVHDIGEEVMRGRPDIRRGDRVIVHTFTSCGECVTCRHGYTYCLNTSAPTGQQMKQTAYGLFRDGGFQKYMVVQEIEKIIKVPDDVPLDVAALVSCSGITAFNAVTNIRECLDTAIEVYGSATVAVVGAGGLALWAIQILKYIYPENVTIVAIDIEDQKLEDARIHGADKAFNWSKKGSIDSEEGISRLVHKFGKDIGQYLDGAIDFTGIQECQLQTFSLLKAGGTLILVGLSASLHHIQIAVTAIILKNITIKGIKQGTTDQCAALLHLLSSNKVKPPPITHITLDDVPESIALMKCNKLVRGRNVVDFGLKT